MVLATNQHIASEFDALSSAVWLLTTYTLAQCSSQPLVCLTLTHVTNVDKFPPEMANHTLKYGKLSDIFGRKKNLAFSWTTFSLGCMVMSVSLVARVPCGPLILTSPSGISKTYWQVLAGRAISGIGAAGMIALTSIVITGMSASRL